MVAISIHIFFDTQMPFCFSSIAKHIRNEKQKSKKAEKLSRKMPNKTGSIADLLTVHLVN